MRPTIHNFNIRTYQPRKYAHIKRDGMLLNVACSDSHGVTAWTNNSINYMPKLGFMRRKVAPGLVNGWSILGELWLPGARSSEIKTAINDESDELEFSPFAIVAVPKVFDGTHNDDTMDDLPLETCKLLLESFGYRFLLWKNITNVVDPRYLLDKLEPDVEGYVLKNGNMSDWCKLKPRLTIDLVVSGFTEGEGKYAGQIGSIVCKTWEGYNVADCSGMPDDTRRHISEFPQEKIGKVIEVVYQNVGEKGRLRFPQFVRFREDKDPSQCLVSQDADLQAIWQRVQ